MIVLDASAAVEWLLRRPAAARLDAMLAAPSVVMHAPAHLPAEVGAALRGLAIGGQMTAARGRQALDDLLAADIELHDPTLLLSRAWELRANFTFYDACYVALAELLDAVLVTTDARLTRAPSLRTQIRLIKPDGISGS